MGKNPATNPAIVATVTDTASRRPLSVSWFLPWPFVMRYLCDASGAMERAS